MDKKVPLKRIVDERFMMISQEMVERLLKIMAVKAHPWRKKNQ